MRPCFLASRVVFEWESMLAKEHLFGATLACALSTVLTCSVVRALAFGVHIWAMAFDSGVAITFLLWRNFRLKRVGSVMEPLRF